MIMGRISTLSRAVAVGVCAGILAVTAGCHKAGGRAPCPSGKLCFEATNDADPATLDPPRTSLTIEANVLSDLLIGLTDRDAAGRLSPGMAQSWSASSDGIVWTFKLRKALWSDGVPVTADDFVYTFRRLEDPKTASDYAYLFYLIKGAEAVNSGRAPLDSLGVRALDPHTVQITLTHPAPYFPEMLTHNVVLPVPRHVVERYGDSWVQPGRFVANGPYLLKSWTLGDRIVLEKNPLFYEAQKVCFDRISYYPAPDPVSAERRFKAGDFDLDIDFLARRARYLRRPDQIPKAVHTPPELADTYMTFNTHFAPFSDQRVRVALSMSTDRDFITKALTAAGEKPTYGFVPAGTANYDAMKAPVWASWPFPRRLAEARKLLSAAGYGPTHPLRFELKYPNGIDPAVAAAMQADWRSIGVFASLVAEEPQIFYQDLPVRDFQAAIAIWVADYDDALTFLNLLQSGTGGQNYGDYNNPEYDALLAQADHEPDAGKRAAILERAEALAMASANIVPLFGRVSRDLVDPRITGWVDNITAFHPKRYLCRSDAAARRAAG